MIRRLLLTFTSLALVGAAIIAPGQAASAAANDHGAIALSPKKGIFVGVVGSSANEVTAKAAKLCYKSAQSGDCQTVIRFRNGYGALATTGGDNVGYGSGWGPTQDDADAHALRICEEDGNTGCYVVKRLVTSNPSAAAEGGALGRVCFFRARNTTSSLHEVVGHIGWAYRDNNRRDNPWTIGATEQLEGWPVELSGQEVESWSTSNLTWDQALKKFRAGGHFAKRLTKPKEYYQAYRCRDTLAMNATAAKSKFESLREGYNLFTDNCLTKAIAILRAYGAELPKSGTGTGLAKRTALKAPNVYFADKLDDYDFLPSTPL